MKRGKNKLKFNITTMLYIFGITRLDYFTTRLVSLECKYESNILYNQFHLIRI
jgi:hypothetical protein